MKNICTCTPRTICDKCKHEMTYHKGEILSYFECSGCGKIYNLEI